MLFSERMTSFERLKGNVPAGCPDIQAPALSSTFNEVIFCFGNDCYNFISSSIVFAADSFRFLRSIPFRVCKMSFVGDLKLFH